MILKILGSGSSGNCYVLENDNEILLLECGIRFDRIKPAIDFNISKVRGCIITHEHKDHCKSVAEVVAAGINTYSAGATLEAMGVASHHRTHAVTHGVPFTVGGFKIMAFDVKHDAIKPFGYLIQHADTGKVLFITDSYYSPGRFQGLNNILLEANYSKAIIDSKVRDGYIAEFLRNRVLRSHMSLETAKDVLRANDLSAVNNIVLIHLSNSNSNATGFCEEITRLTGKTVTIADAGITIPFNKTPF
jgi:phosphoribosyl 1,2-cyclic phosphodiesterase